MLRRIGRRRRQIAGRVIAALASIYFRSPTPFATGHHNHRCCVSCFFRILYQSVGQRHLRIEDRTDRRYVEREESSVQ